MDETREEVARRRLLARRAELRAARGAPGGGEPRSIGEATGELSTYDNHPADVATETTVRAQEVAFRDGARRAIERVEAALRRLDQGTYGRCLRCGGPIEEGRLAVLPEAELCAGCARASEREELS